MLKLTIPGGKRQPGLCLVLLLCGLATLLLLRAAEPGTARAATGSDGQVSIVVLPAGTAPGQLTALKEAAIGLMNPGLGEVSAQQTWLDVSQGARAFDSSYDTSLDRVFAAGESTVGWEKAVKRARSTETTLVPGLFASVLGAHGLQAAAAESAGSAALSVVRRDGELTPAPRACGGPGRMIEPGSAAAEAAIPGCPDPVTVLSMPLASAVEASERRRPGDLMIFIEQPPARSGEQLSIAIAGPGTEGALLSPSTRTAGYVLSTDLAPTVLEHFGIKTPKAMTGLPIESGGELDLERLNELQSRYEQVGKRRGAALAIPLLLWIALAALVTLASRGLYSRPAVRLLCLSTVLLPGVLLLTAALEPSLAVERAIATVLPVLIAGAIMRFVPGWPGLGVACGLTVIPYGLDMLAGSALTPRAVIGPNPGLGARFYGIGNELESTLMILTSIGTGALLTWNLTPARRAAMWFLVVGAIATIVFATGRFGADVGAAIVFPVAAVVAASFSVGRPRLAWAGLAVAAVALLLIGLVDLVVGGETHFVRSIVGGSGGSIFEVIGRRLDATLESFTRVSRVPVTLAALLTIAIGVWKRDRISDWLADLPLMRAAIAAAAAGSLIGALSNDSGALFIQVGTLYLALVLGFVWTTTGRTRK